MNYTTGLRLPLACAAAFFILHGPTALGAPKADKALTSLDLDKDGSLSMDEAKAAADKKFDALDADHDSTLDPGEAKSGVSAKIFKKADPDSDGTLSKTEWEALVARRFAAADTDKDGTLTAKELATPKGKSLLKLLQY